MIIPVNKEKALKEFKEKYVDNAFSKEEVNNYIHVNNKKIKSNIISKFQEVFKKAINFQEEGRKGDIKYIYISYLRAYLLEDKVIFRIDLYDENWFLDKEECSIYIDLSDVFSNLFSVYESLKVKRKEYNRVITEMDLENIKISAWKEYKNISIYIFKNMVPSIINCELYKSMKKKEILIMAGEYRDDVTLIYSEDKDVGGEDGLFFIKAR
ncbi:hypothetical protein [uncultured Clostridium sp.]|uniref:hypothetical protein n=1 Tax=uncultured Clostridium sp. TaxID=59620 RepID=UPI0025F2768F|nr:hypothetical protein [uncultured Clostridium sp.]